MNFYTKGKDIKIKEETLDYMAEMMKKAKWDGRIVFDNDERTEDGFLTTTNEILLNPKYIEEEAKQMGKDPDLLMLSTFAHELYHAVDPDKEIRRENHSKMFEYIYEETSDFKTDEEIERFASEINKFEKKVMEDIIISEAKTNNALDFFPENHPNLQELKRTFIESNIQANQTYVDNDWIKSLIRNDAITALEDKKNGIPLEEQKDYNDLKKHQLSIKMNLQRQFDEWRFDTNKKHFIDLEKEKGTIIERMKPEIKQKEQMFEKEVEVKMLKEKIQLTKVHSWEDMMEGEITVSRAHTIATEEIKEKTKSSIKDKTVEVFKTIQSQFKQLKTRQTTKEKTNEHTL